MRVLHIVAGLPPVGGISESVPRLCLHLQGRGHEVTIATLDGTMSDAALEVEEAGVRLVRFRASWPRVLFFSWQMLRQLRAVCAEADVAHVHSLWTFPVWWGCRCALREGKPLVISPRGCLDPVRLAHSAWKKRLAGWLDRGFLRKAAAVHVTSEAERGWVEEFLRPPDGAVDTAPSEVVAKTRVKKIERIVVVPNGVETGKNQTTERTEGTEEEVAVGKSSQQYGRRDTGDGRHGKVVFFRKGAKAQRGGGEEVLKLEGKEDAKRTRTVLYLGRNHPLKGLDLLVEAWGLLRPPDGAVDTAPSEVVAMTRVKALGETGDGHASGLGSGRNDESKKGEGNQRSEVGDQRSATNELPPWRLVVAGPDEQGTLKALKEQVARLGLEESVVFAGPVYGEEKWRLLRSADLFVLPTRSENFGIVVAEALAAGVPVITTRGAPWAELLGLLRPPDGAANAAPSEVVAMTRVKREALQTNGRCGWWVEVGVEPLADALREALGLTDEERRIMGENGRRLVEAKYRWEAVAERLAAVYAGLLRPPDGGVDTAPSEVVAITRVKKRGRAEGPSLSG